MRLRGSLRLVSFLMIATLASDVARKLWGPRIEIATSHPSG